MYEGVHALKFEFIEDGAETMVNSINTNAGSLQGVQSLQKANSSLANTQERITTGRDVNGPQDNAALLAISQILESDVGGLNSVRQSLDRAISSTDVAVAGAEEVSNTLIQLRETAVQAADPGLDDASRQALSQQFNALRDQITGIVENSSFNGTNALQSGGDAISAITSPDGDSSVTVGAQDLSLGGPNVTLTDSQGIGSAADAQAAVAAIDASIANVTASLSELGAASQEFTATREFSQTLENVTREGIGNLVDTNLAEASAQLAADQVRQTLGTQALSISNSQPSNILSLFEQS